MTGAGAHHDQLQPLEARVRDRTDGLVTQVGDGLEGWPGMASSSSAALPQPSGLELLDEQRGVFLEVELGDACATTVSSLAVTNPVAACRAGTTVKDCPSQSSLEGLVLVGVELDCDLEVGLGEEQRLDSGRSPRRCPPVVVVDSGSVASSTRRARWWWCGGGGGRPGLVQVVAGDATADEDEQEGRCDRATEEETHRFCLAANGSAKVPRPSGGTEGQGLHPLGDHVDHALGPLEPALHQHGRCGPGHPAVAGPAALRHDHVDQAGLVPRFTNRVPRRWPPLPVVRRRHCHLASGRRPGRRPAHSQAVEVLRRSGGMAVGDTPVAQSRTPPPRTGPCPAARCIGTVTTPPAAGRDWATAGGPQASRRSSPSSRRSAVASLHCVR